MKFLVLEIIGNALMFGILVYPAYLLGGSESLAAMGAAAAAVYLVFALTMVALHKRLSRPNQYTSALMLGKMGVHMIGMILMFVLLPWITGMELESIMPWLIVFFFINIGMEMAYLLDLSKKLAREAENA
jgi:hypothetical protein